VVFELSCWLYWLRIWSQNSGHGWIVANSYILVKLLFLCSLVHALSIGLSWNWIMLEAIGCLVCLCILAPWVLSDLFKACRMYLYVVLHYCTVVTGKFPTALQLHARLFEGSECLYQTDEIPWFCWPLFLHYLRNHILKLLCHWLII
jgi:hypothetical protein